jgi:peptidoglycan/LPS O-acetylase OafA/YrhL
MPIMFALAGSLVASSLDRSPLNPWSVLRKRTRRLLPPLWALGAVTIPLMLTHRWTFNADTGIGAPLDWHTMLLWILPISDPPGSAWAADWTVPLWYLRAYLWFLLLSPALLWLFRRWPRRTLAMPFIGLLAACSGAWSLEGRSGEVLLNMMMFGGCWMLGFAHHDNKIRTIPRRKIIPAAAALMAVGLTYALTHQGPGTGWDIDDIPLADTLWGTGAVLLLLRFYPDFSWMARVPVLDKAVAAINTRAMTIYLWNNPAIFLSTPVIDFFPITRSLDNGGVAGHLMQLGITVLLIIVAILALGWVEDLAARRRPRVNPWPRVAKPTPQGLEHRRPAYSADVPGMTGVVRLQAESRASGAPVASIEPSALPLLHPHNHVRSNGAPSSDRHPPVRELRPNRKTAVTP